MLKVLEKASDDIKNTVFGAHSQVSPFAHGEVSPRQGDITFCENQSRMEEVVESKEIGYGRTLRVDLTTLLEICVLCSVTVTV